MDTVTIAILAKDKAHCLPLYLSCIAQQTFPKDRTYLYVRTNNNNDNTQQVLEEWLNYNKHLYREIYYDPSNVEARIEAYKPHEWNELRFDILGRIRQNSLTWAKEKGSHYFVADCDNFIAPDTISNLLETNLPVVGPFLKTKNNYYSNYHLAITADGYCKASPEYFLVHAQVIRGLIMVGVIHCTYLVRYNVLTKPISYLPDGTSRHEYVIFSESLRKLDIAQYLDNRKVYGQVTFADNIEDLTNDISK